MGALRLYLDFINPLRDADAADGTRRDYRASD